MVRSFANASLAVVNSRSDPMSFVSSLQRFACWAISSSCFAKSALSVDVMSGGTGTANRGGLLSPIGGRISSSASELDVVGFVVWFGSRLAILHAPRFVKKPQNAAGARGAELFFPVLRLP